MPSVELLYTLVSINSCVSYYCSQFSLNDDADADADD